VKGGGRSAEKREGSEKKAVIEAVEHFWKRKKRKSTKKEGEREGKAPDHLLCFTWIRAAALLHKGKKEKEKNLFAERGRKGKKEEKLRSVFFCEDWNRGNVPRIEGGKGKGREKGDAPEKKGGEREEVTKTALCVLSSHQPF